MNHDLDRYVAPIARAVRDGEPQLALDLFRVIPPEDRPDVVLRLLELGVRPPAVTP